MSADNAVDCPFVEPDSQEQLRVDCYVRSAVPPAVSERVSSFVERLRTLDERDAVAAVRVRQWPSRTAIADADRSTRTELVAEFERWADRNNYSLEPAFRRQVVPSSPLGVDDGPRERVRVPLIALAFYDPEANADERPLRGVVPCTDREETNDGRTYTVDRCLTVLEMGTSESPTRTAPDGRTAVLEGQR